MLLLVVSSTAFSAEYSVPDPEQIRAIREAQQTIIDCGQDQRCVQDAVSRLQRIEAGIPWPVDPRNPDPQVKNADCGWENVGWERCLPIVVQVKAGTENEQIYEDVREKERQAYHYEVNGFLVYNGTLETFRLYTLHNFSSDIVVDDFLYEVTGKDIDPSAAGRKTLEQLDPHGSLNSSFSVEARSTDESGFISFSGPVFVFPDNSSYGGISLNPEVMVDAEKGDEPYFPVVTRNQIRVSRADMRKLINGETWHRRLEWHRDWHDGRGSHSDSVKNLSHFHQVT